MTKQQFWERVFGELEQLRRRVAELERNSIGENPHSVETKPENPNLLESLKGWLSANGFDAAPVVAEYFAWVEQNQLREDLPLRASEWIADKIAALSGGR